jgi:electron transfer flavoprotein beta subunit
MMRIYVCVKHVPDSAATITVKDGNRIDESIIFMMNPFDENAVEEAVRTKERHEDSEVIAVTFGKEPALNTLRSAMAMGADRGIFVKTDDYPDDITTARALTAAIKQDGEPDVIFTGKESIDSAGMQTMYRLAADFKMPVSTNAVAFSIDGGRATVKRETEAGAMEIVEFDLPCVVAAGKGLNTPRYATFKDIMKANQKPVSRIDFEILDLSPPSSKTEIVELKPFVEDRKQLILDGPPQEAVNQLINLLGTEAKLFY